jgi:hypothetical protein
LDTVGDEISHGDEGAGSLDEVGDSATAPPAPDAKLLGYAPCSSYPRQ